MPIEYYKTNKDDLLQAMRREFSFLESHYGYIELIDRPESYPNPYSVLYRRPPVEVLIEGISYGWGTNIMFRVRKNFRDIPEIEFCVSWITAIRRPDLHEPQFPEKRGQLLQLPKLADQLRAVGDDFLRGDLSILPEVRMLIAKAHEEAEKNEKLLEFRRVEARSQEAFRNGEYSLVILQLEPFRDLLNPSSRKRLDIAKSRL